jgi:hypothetical protein
MDLEQLTKHQIVLLTLLVSFVTSIATGIVTVSLMNQAPPEISRTINQIVERTVQTVTTPAAAVVSQPTTVKTVVVNNDDLAAQSIAAVQKSMIRIVDTKDPKTLVARGVIVDKGGTAITDRTALVASGADSFAALLPDGTMVSVTVVKGQATSTDTLLLSLDVGTTTGWTAAPVADVSKVKLGQSVIRIGGTGADSIAIGIVSAAPHDGLIESSVSSATPGAVLITLFGEVLGVVTGASNANTYSVPVTTLPKSPAATQPATNSV